MKLLSYISIGLIFLAACGSPTVEEENLSSSLPIIGSWKLLSGTIINGQDTTTTNYTDGQEFIKIINETHFAFLRHDLDKGQDSNAVFVAGGGRYSLEGNTYTEHLQYCNFREWEDNKFAFELTLHGDTLVSRGIEKVEELGVEHLNIETYIKIKD